MRVEATTPIQLVLKEERRVIVEFPDGYEGAAKFAEKSYYLQEAMRTSGIHITPFDQQEYDFPKDKNRITLEDKRFGWAFYELYFKREMQSSELFEWQTIENKG